MKSTFAAVTALLLVLTVPVGAMVLHGERIEADSSNANRNEACLFFADSRDTGHPGITAFDGHVGELTVELYEWSGVEAIQSPGVGPLPSAYVVNPPPGYEPVDTLRVTKANVRLTEATSASILMAYSAVPFTVQGDTGSIRVESIVDPILGAGGIMDDATATPAQGGSGFSAVRADGPHAVSHIEDAFSHLILKGDLVIEFSGIDLEIQDGSDTYSVRGTEDREDATGQPLADDQAHTVTKRFVRMYATAASMRVHVAGEHTRTQWTATTTAADFPAGLTLHGARGEMEGTAIQGTQRLEALSASIVAADSGLRLEGASVPHAQAVAAGSAQDMTLIGALMVLTGISFIVTVGMAIRAARRTPSMDEVEAALAQGRLRTGTRLARRVARHRPHLQDATMSVAIGLAKQGKHAQAVAAVEQHLESRGAEDGTLHYLLGLSLMELGDKDRGKAALTEAVRRTPDLRSQAAVFLVTPAAPDGQAYA